MPTICAQIWTRCCPSSLPKPMGASPRLIAHGKTSVWLLALFLLGTGFGVVGQEGSFFRTAWVKSYLKMHDSLLAGPGEVRLTVMHNDEQALLALVKNTPSLLDVSKSGFSNVAYVRAAKGNEHAYRLLRDMPFVRFVLRNQIIFFCH